MSEKPMMEAEVASYKERPPRKANSAYKAMKADPSQDNVGRYCQALGNLKYHRLHMGLYTAWCKKSRAGRSKGYPEKAEG